MVYRVIWTEPAADDLQAIFDYVNAHSPVAARRTVDTILQRVGLLKTAPLIGAVYPRGTTGPYRYVVAGKYRIFYRPREALKQVEILSILHHSRQDPTFSDD